MLIKLLNNKITKKQTDKYGVKNQKQVYANVPQIGKFATCWCAYDLQKLFKRTY